MSDGTWRPITELQHEDLGTEIDVRDGFVGHTGWVITGISVDYTTDMVTLNLVDPSTVVFSAVVKTTAQWRPHA